MSYKGQTQKDTDIATKKYVEDHGGGGSVDVDDITIGKTADDKLQVKDGGLELVKIANQGETEAGKLLGIGDDGSVSPTANKPIIDVSELPTSDINENAFYRVGLQGAVFQNRYSLADPDGEMDDSGVYIGGRTYTWERISTNWSTWESSFVVDANGDAYRYTIGSENKVSYRGHGIIEELYFRKNGQWKKHDNETKFDEDSIIYDTVKENWKVSDGYTNRVIQQMLDLVHPVGSSFLQRLSSENPNDLFNDPVKGISSTWELSDEVQAGDYMMIDNDKTVGTRISEELPNVKGATSTGVATSYNGAFTDHFDGLHGAKFAVGDTWIGANNIMDLSKGQTNSDGSYVPQAQSVFKDGGKVHPQGFTVKLWVRTA